MAGLIPDQVVEQVRQANDVVEVIGAYFPLKRAGASYRALCPFHKEKTPSFNVNQQRQIWHCFGCGKGGDVFKFLMEYENLEFTAAVRRLAERAGIHLEETAASGGPRRDEKEALLKLHDAAANWFQDNLKHAPAARAYLQKRGLSDAAVKRWRIGYAPESWDACLNWARARKIPEALLETAGLVVRTDEGRVYDRFRDRLMFSICDEQGRVVAFSGRILTADKEQAKYVNSPETPIFQKGKLLFALDKARRAIIEAKFAVVCEGQVDTIACHEAGLEHVVAPQGTALTEHHARILKRYADEVVLMFDADTAGQNAAMRSAEPLLAAGLVIRVATLPGEHDPDSFLKANGVEPLQEIITAAPGFFTFYLERLTKLHDARTDRGKLQIAQQIVEWIAKVPHAVLRASQLQQTAMKLGVPESALQQELRQYRQRDRTVATPAETTAPAEDPGHPAETLLLQLMLTDERVVPLVQQQLAADWLSTGTAAELMRKVLRLHAAAAWNGHTSLLGADASDEAHRLVTRLLEEKRPAPERIPAAAGDCLAALKRAALERQFQAIKLRLAQPGLSGNEVTALQQQILDLRRNLDHIPRLSVWRSAKP